MPKPIYALVGPDALLQQEAILQVLRELPEDAQRADADGESAELGEIFDELRSFAMFGGGKIVVIRNADPFVSKYRSQLEEYAAAPSDSSTLVLRLESLPANQRIYKAISKTGLIIPCEPPKDLAKWVMDRGKTAHNLAVTRDAAALFADLIGGDLGRIDNELAKLAIVSDTGKIDADQVADSVAFQRDREMWDLTNALAAGDPGEAMRRWRQLVGSDSSAEFRAVTWLCLWLENCRKALLLLEQGQNAFTIGQALRIWPRDMQQKFVDNVRELGERGVRRAIDQLAEIDYQTKTGVGNAADNVERFILSLDAL